MAINFTQLLTDSCNFIRNKPQQMLFFFTLFFFAFIILNFQTADVIVDFSTIPHETSPQLNPDRLFHTMLIHFGIFILSNWCMLSVHQSSQGALRSATQMLTQLLKRILGLLVIKIFLLLPLLISLSDVMMGFLTSNASSLLSVLMIPFSIYVYVRLCLADVHYLVTTTSLLQSLRDSWQGAKNHGAELLIYCLLISVVLPASISALSYLGDGWLFSVLIAAINAGVSLIALLFTYRFYSVLMQKGR